MIYLLSAVLFSVLVSVWLKLAARLRLDVPQMVAWNYLAAGGLIAWWWHPPLVALLQGHTPWWAMLGLGVLLPVIFMVLGASVRHAGIVRSDVAQRLSLLLSLLAAFAWFGEAFDLAKAAGIGLGLLALVCLVWRREPAGPHGEARGRWLYPLLVLIGFAAIDVMLKQVAQAGVPFTVSLLGAFALALLVALLIQLGRWRFAGVAWQAHSLGGGLLLGLLNAGNIICYVRAHQALAASPSLVFAGMNLGVVSLGALVGWGLFRERLSAVNLAGLALAGLAILRLAA